MKVMWTWNDGSGHEACEWSRRKVEGVALIARQGKPWTIPYVVEWDAAGRTRRARVGNHRVEVDGRRRWTLDGRRVASVDGCLDIDLNFSPCTNTLPIRRLKLKPGESAVIRAAWLRFPSFTLEPLEQGYRRVSASIYRYVSAGFRASLEVDRSGVVLRYGKVWTAVALEK